VDQVRGATCFVLRKAPMVVCALALAAATPTWAGADQPPSPSAPPPAAKPRTAPARAFDPVVTADATRRYTGDPISLSLKDADIRDVLKTFAILTRLNIVVDPAVRGSVTVELRDVPWDQAFELILTVNGLGYQMLDNVVYVAPAATLARRPLYAP
jgi:type II secretory pathway component HofQ